MPRELVAIVGKTELLIDLGVDRRRALERHPAALADLKHQIAVARRKADLEAGEPSPARLDLHSPQEIAALNYFERVVQDEEWRNSDPSYAQISIDDLFVLQLRRGISGAATDRDLAELVGHRFNYYRLIGYTTVEFGARGWRELARILCLSELEALERVLERDEGNFDGRSSNPMFAVAENTQPSDEAAPVSILGLFDDYLRHRKLHQNSRGPVMGRARRRAPAAATPGPWIEPESLGDSLAVAVSSRHPLSAASPGPAT